MGKLLLLSHSVSKTMVTAYSLLLYLQHNDELFNTEHGWRMSYFDMHGQRMSYLTGQLKNVVSRRAEEERRITPYTGHVLTVKVLRYDVVQPGAEIQRCFAQSSICGLAVHLKDEQHVYFKHGSEKKWSIKILVQH